MAPLIEEYAGPGGLVIGIGNLAREDDGLGWAFLDRLEQRRFRGELVRAYQLQLEDADLVSRADRVLVVDSTTDPAVSTYALTTPEPRLEVAFTSHALTIPTVLEVCRQCFGVLPATRVLALRGHSFDLVEGLTPAGTRSLEAALAAVAASERPVAAPVPNPV